VSEEVEDVQLTYIPSKTGEQPKELLTNTWLEIEQECRDIVKREFGEDLPELCPRSYSDVRYRLFPVIALVGLVEPTKHVGITVSGTARVVPVYAVINEGRLSLCMGCMTFRSISSGAGLIGCLNYIELDTLKSESTTSAAFAPIRFIAYPTTPSYYAVGWVKDVPFCLGYYSVEPTLTEIVKDLVGNYMAWLILSDHAKRIAKEMIEARKKKGEGGG